MTGTARSRNKGKQVAAKNAVRKILEEHKYALHAAVKHEDKAEQRKLAEQAVSQWQSKQPALRNLSDVLRRRY